VIRHLSGSSELRIGGGELVVAFFEEALRMHVEHLLVLTPYVDDSVFADQALRNLWKRTIATVESTIVVRTTQAADAVLRSTQFMQRHCSVRIDPRLHAKVFLAWRPGAELALVGSHNLTGAALHANKEIGILIKPSASGMRVIVWQLRAALEAIARSSNLYRTTCLVRTRPSVAGSESCGNGVKQ